MDTKAQAPARTGHVVGNYELLEALREGEAATTYRAKDQTSGNVVAIKVLPLRGLPSWAYSERFDREVETLRSVTHPSIARFVEAFEYDDEAEGPASVLVSEFEEGQTLEALIEDGHRWSETEIRDLLRGLLEALDYLHTLNPPVVHGDIRPSNIIVRPDASPVLLDFGAASTRAGDLVSTPRSANPFAAPEAVRGEGDHRTDLYSLGATIVAAMTHDGPPAVDDATALYDVLACSTSLTAVLEKLVAADVSQRFDSARQALEMEAAHPEGASAPVPRGALARVAVPRPLPDRLRKELRTDNVGSTRIGLMLVGGAAMLPLLLLVPTAGAVALGAAIVGGTGWLLYRATRASTNTAQRLYTHGMAQTVPITKVSSGEGGLFASYSYLSRGQALDGWTKLTEAEASSVRAGDRIHVFFDPSDPRTHVSVFATTLDSSTQTGPGRSLASSGQEWRKQLRDAP